MSFIYPDGKTAVTTTILAFVDDTSGILNSLGICHHKACETKELEQVSQMIMKSYETYLHMTGVQVNLIKTFVYHLVPDHFALVPRFKA